MSTSTDRLPHFLEYLNFYKCTRHHIVYYDVPMTDYFKSECMMLIPGTYKQMMEDYG